jgi:DNA polymerase III subunit delta'
MVLDARGALFEGVVGQERALAHLDAALDRPVHAYLFLGPAGSSKEAAARGFAAGLVCPLGGCGQCESCRRALRGVHPDITVLERTGASLTVEEIRTATARALRRPTEGIRQVLVLDDVHLATRSTPALLKTLEEPPASTVFVLTADDVPPALSTVASRCATVSFASLSEPEVSQWLVDRGVDPLRARLVASGAAGDLQRAALLAGDDGFLDRLDRWKAVPARLDGTGSAAAQAADELLGSLDDALEPLRQHHADEVARLEAEARERGERGLPGRREVLDRQQRAERRWKTDELRCGLAVLQREYRDRLRAVLEQLDDEPTTDRLLDEARRDADAVDRLTAASAALRRNVQPPLLLASLLSELGAAS